MRVEPLMTEFVQKTKGNNRAKAVVLLCNSYRFASESLSVCGVNAKELPSKTYRFRAKRVGRCPKTTENVVKNV